MHRELRYNLWTIREKEGFVIKVSDSNKVQRSRKSLQTGGYKSLSNTSCPEFDPLWEQIFKDLIALCFQWYR